MDMNMSEPSIPEAIRQIRAGQISPIELVDRCIKRIDRFEDRIHAWVLVDAEGARQRALELSDSPPVGPLHGIPVGIKDIVDIAGWPTQAGSPLLEGNVARQDAPIVTALRRAGAIILGKTVTVEFACFDPSPTRNPWSATLEHTPGGSSSGSAAALAVGMCMGAIGTQTGGSLVRPSTYCGVATCKPTFGRVSRRRIAPVSYHLDHPGPMARTVDDLRALLQVIMPSQSAGPSLGSDVVDDPAAPPNIPPRLGRIDQFFMEHDDASVAEVTRLALATLDQAGAKIVPVAFPDGFEQIQPMHRRIMAVEAAEVHRERFRQHREGYGPKIAGLLDEGLSISAVDYAAALSDQRRFRRRVARWLEDQDVDALVMPSTDTTAPATLETTGTPKFQAPWSCAGLPVVSIPAGLASDGMPSGIQLVGRPHSEEPLLSIARWCEQQIAFHEAPPLVM